MKVKETTNEGMDPCNNRGAFGSLVVLAGSVSLPPISSACSRPERSQTCLWVSSENVYPSVSPAIFQLELVVYVEHVDYLLFYLMKRQNNLIQEQKQWKQSIDQATGFAPQTGNSS